MKYYELPEKVQEKALENIKQFELENRTLWDFNKLCIDALDGYYNLNGLNPEIDVQQDKVYVLGYITLWDVFCIMQDGLCGIFSDEEFSLKEHKTLENYYITMNGEKLRIRINKEEKFIPDVEQWAITYHQMINTLKDKGYANIDTWAIGHLSEIIQQIVEDIEEELAQYYYNYFNEMSDCEALTCLGYNNYNFDEKGNILC